MPRLLIVTDAWHPQVNGVVRSLESVGNRLEQRGFEVRYLTPDPFWTLPLPTYSEIRVPVPSLWRIAEFLADYDPDHIHIATEGPLGLAVRAICVAQGLAFTTSYHTRFPEYLATRLPVPIGWSYGYLRWFHAPAARTLVPTRSMLKALRRQLFRHLSIWSRGVDTGLFNPGPKAMFTALRGPHMLYVGRVSVEKGIEDFLKLDGLAGTKVVVGDGPQRAELMERYPGAVFTGTLTGAALRDAYRSADVLVFPSRTDTFGNVMLEAMACGTPVAAYPVMGPIDVVAQGMGGILSEDLQSAITGALGLDRAGALMQAKTFTWDAAADQFAGALVSARPRMALAA